MPDQDEDLWGRVEAPSRQSRRGPGQNGLIASGLAMAARALLADGDERDVKAASTDGVFQCDPLGCIGTVKRKTVALVRHPGALEEDCRVADIVIAPFTVTKKCRAARVIVDRRMLKAQGAHALFIEGLSIRTETVAQKRGRRPWSGGATRDAPRSGGNPDR